MFRAYRRGASQKEIAEKFGCSQQLVVKYKKKFDWDERVRMWRESNHASTEKLLERRRDAIENGTPDDIWKIQKTMQAIDAEFDRLAYTIEIMDDFLAFVKENHPKVFKDYQEILPEFLSDQRNKYDKK